MAAKINLDAMIPRADFALEPASTDTGEKIQSLGVEQLSDNSLVKKNLRKPDFQRETNHWSQSQLLSFLKSYVDRELIPSVILWQSPSFIFVIDGAHRLSALSAWIADDYGDGLISRKFYNHEIPEEQKKIAGRVRRVIHKEIGPFSELKAAVGQTEGFSDLLRARASITASRTFSLQWVEGDAEKAETSFFKINTQGTPLHKTEERLLRGRRQPIAIASRSIVRAATGNKYWSHFDLPARKSIEEHSRELHELLFTPEINEPIKTLDLPLGGSSSPIDALNLLMDMIEASAGEKGDGSKNDAIFQDDGDGEATIDALKQCLSVLRRITGNGPGSLGLHPAVYFYGSKGKHSQHLFLSTVTVIAKNIKSNNKGFFKKFTGVRRELEECLIENKFLIGQAIVQIRSTSRVQRLAEMFEYIVETLAEGQTIEPEGILGSLKLQGKLLATEIEASQVEFSKGTKSEIFLNASLEQALKCSICGGFVDPQKSVSYDHIERVEDGGKGGPENGQLTHPYCNTAYKN